MNESESRRRPWVSPSVGRTIVAMLTGVAAAIPLAARLDPQKGRFIELSGSKAETIRILDTVTGTVSACTTRADHGSACTEVTESTNGTDSGEERVGIPEMLVTTGPGRARIDWTFQNHPGRPAIEWQYRLDGGRWTATARSPHARHMTLWFNTNYESSATVRRSIQIRGIDHSGVGIASEAIEFTVEPAVDYSELLYGGPLTPSEVKGLRTILHDSTTHDGTYTPYEARAFNEAVAWIARNNRECQALVREELANPEPGDQDNEADNPCTGYEELRMQLAAATKGTR